MTQHAISAYARTAQTGTSNRELEAILLMKSATRLQQVQEKWDQDRSDLDGAILYNRKLWTILSVAATDADSELPQDIKKNIAMIAVFIFNRSLDLIFEPQKEALNALIDINRNIAEGLMASPDNTQDISASQSQAS